MEVLQNGLERTSISTMVQAHVGQSSRVEGCRAFALRCCEQLRFSDEQEFGVSVDEPFDQARTCDPIDLDVLARNPAHR